MGADGEVWTDGGTRRGRPPSALSDLRRRDGERWEDEMGRRR